MRDPTVLLAIASLALLPIEANAAQYAGSEVRTGTFVGARFKMPLGGRSVFRPRAALAIAPTISSTSEDGDVRTSIGEGVALNLGTRPTLTLMGVRADQALGIGQSGRADAEGQLAVSSGGWVAIGVGALVLTGGLVFLHIRDVARDNSD